MAYNREDNSELRRLQLTELNLARVFSDFCEKNGLRYYMVGGTMLGAIRHKGFIPWDDDMDFGMPRPDYERMLDLIRAQLPEGVSFLNYKQDPEYNRYFSRIVDTRVTVVNASNTKTIRENAWIDIFPFDGMPASPFWQKQIFWKLTFWRFLYSASCFDELVNLNRPGRQLSVRAAIKFLQATRFGRKFNTKKLMGILERKLMKIPYDENPYMVSFFGAYMLKEIVDKRLLGEGKKYPFEDVELNGPVEYDEFLRHFYGDYMTPPSDEDKDKHNIERIEYAEEEK